MQNLVTLLSITVIKKDILVASNATRSVSDISLILINDDGDKVYLSKDYRRFFSIKFIKTKKHLGF